MDMKPPGEHLNETNINNIPGETVLFTTGIKWYSLFEIEKYLNRAKITAWEGIKKLWK